jgi:hypothetical protein
VAARVAPPRREAWPASGCRFMRMDSNVCSRVDTAVAAAVTVQPAPYSRLPVTYRSRPTVVGMLGINPLINFCVLGTLTATIGCAAFASVPPVLADESTDRVQVMHAFVDAWNVGDVDSVVNAFSPDATIEGSDGCCAASGALQIRPFVMARFADAYQIGWAEPELSGETLVMWSRVSAQDGLNAGVDLAQGGGPDDPEAALIQATFTADKISSLHLGTSAAAMARTSALRTGVVVDRNDTYAVSTAPSAQSLATNLDQLDATATP